MLLLTMLIIHRAADTARKPNERRGALCATPAQELPSLSKPESLRRACSCSAASAVGVGVGVEEEE